MHVGIIGAGISGLASARRAQQYNLECTVFEATGSIGGTWVYHENPFTDEFNNPVYSSLYASARIIAPHQVMELEGLEFKPKSGLSYPGHEEVLEYYQNYCKKYNLQQYIKFHHQVLRISRETKVWKLIIKDLRRNTLKHYQFDVIVLCNGRFSKPQLPEIIGAETFCGDQIHSHYYRRNDRYKDKRLLIVGAAISGQDISTECSKVAKKVYISYRTAPIENLGKNVEIKGPISSIDGCKVQFKDGTHIYADSIIYCTGYEYDTSVLDPSCGIEVLGGQILKPLYKMFINANQPTMAIIGLLKRTVVVKILDLQAEAFMKYLSGLTQFPSKEDMLKSFHEEYRKRGHRGIHYYDLEKETKAYYDDLAKMANLKPMPLVLLHIWLHSVKSRNTYFPTARNEKISVIDDKNFKIEEIDDTQNEVKAINEYAGIKAKL